jgi:surface-adhesin protein E
MNRFAKLSTVFSLLAVLLLSVESAHAEWVIVSGNDENRFVIYADPDSIRKNGELVGMWDLWDYALEQTYFDHPYLSLKRQAEYDCKGKRARKLSVTTYTGNMGNGTVGFHSNTEEAWSPVAPGTINEELWEYACSKKSR